ncbi:MAG: AIPR family protein, partial [Nitrosopumilus sp.]
GGVIQLIQCKYGESHDNSKIIKFQDDVDKFLKSKLEDIPRQDMKQLLVMIKKENLEPELIYITNQETDFKSDTIKVKVFGFNHIVDKLWDELVGIPEGIQESIELEELMLYKDTVIGILSLSQLRKFVNKTQSYIYESNIRKYLQRTKINKGLKKTLEDSASNVFYYNNGVTIVVKDFKIDGKKMTLLEPQIVNGAQTSQTIYEYLPLITNVKGEVQLTIIKESNDTTRKDITRFRNSQNSVKGKDLISLQSFHTGIRGQLKNFGFYYEQQAGAWLFMKPQERAMYTDHDEYSKYLPEDHENKIQAKDAIQAMVAGIFENPTQPYSSIASFMPNGRHYPEVFDSKLKENYRLLLYPYLVKCYGERLGYGDLEAKPEQKRYARLLFVTAYFKILFDYILKKDK